MTQFRIKRGLDLPLGQKPPTDKIDTSKDVKHIALLGADYIGLRPRFNVSPGDHVKRGEVLFTDKKNSAVKFTSPGSGKIQSINRGEKRKFLSIVIELDEKEEEILFPCYKEKNIPGLSPSNVKDILTDSGLWTSIRQRPFGKIADPNIVPRSIFITAMDTNPLAPPVDVMLKGRELFFMTGINILSILTQGKLFLCKGESDSIPEPENSRVEVHTFIGPHPAGNPGTHIHLLDPVFRGRIVWHVHAQDVADMGELFLTGSVPVFKIISIAGKGVKYPGLFRVRKGSSVSELLDGNLKEGKFRNISGSVFNGHCAAGHEDFLGEYHNQITVISDDIKRPFLGWMGPGLHAYSVKNAVLSKFIPKNRYEFDTGTHGGTRAIIPIGSYEKVNVFDIEPAYLLRALAVDDLDEAEKLGCLELTEEDLALLTFVCPSKIDHGANLRRVLTKIEKEG